MIQRTVSSSSSRSHPSNHSQLISADEFPKDEIEKALGRLTRDDLAIALGCTKVQMDKLDAKVEAQVLEYKTLQASSDSAMSQLNLAEAENQSLHLVIKQREEQIDEIMADQERMGSEVCSKMQVIERLRKQLNDSKKRRNDAERGMRTK